MQRHNNISITGFLCCGIKELYGVSYYPRTPRRAFIDFLASYGYMPLRAGAFIFTDAYPSGSSPSYGARFAAFLIKNKLGNITEVEPFHNPNSHNKVITYIWAPDQDAVVAWHRKNVLKQKVTASPFLKGK